MRRRFAAAITCGVMAIALALASPGLAGFKSGQYVGTTSQKDQVDQRLNVGLQVPKNKKKVNIVYFEFLNIGCGNVTQIAGVSAKLKPSGRFKLSEADPVFSSGYVKGRFEGKKATGTAEFPDRCPGVIEWKAKKS